MTAHSSRELEQQMDYSHMSSSSSSPCTEPEAAGGAGMPERFALIRAPTALTASLCAVLEAAVAQADANQAGAQDTMTVFHALEAPSISVGDYVCRVSKYAFCSEACLVTGYHYMMRAIRGFKNLTLTSLTVHRLLITAVVLACKYMDDTSYNLAYYAKVGGLPAKELANLEVHMLRMLDFRLGVSARAFAAVETRIVQRVHALAAAADAAAPACPPAAASLARKARALLEDARLFAALPTSPLPPCDTDDDDDDGNTEYERRDYSLKHEEENANAVSSRASSHSSVPAPSTVSTESRCSREPPSSPVSSDAASDSLSRNSSSDALAHSLPTVSGVHFAQSQYAPAAGNAGATTFPASGMLPPHAIAPQSQAQAQVQGFARHAHARGAPRAWRRDIARPAPVYPQASVARTVGSGFGMEVSAPASCARPLAPPRRTYHLHHHVYQHASQQQHHMQQQQHVGFATRSQTCPSISAHSAVALQAAPGRPASVQHQQQGMVMHSHCAQQHQHQGVTAQPHYAQQQQQFVQQHGQPQHTQQQPTNDAGHHVGMQLVYSRRSCHSLTSLC